MNKSIKCLMRNFNVQFTRQGLIHSGHVGLSAPHTSSRDKSMLFNDKMCSPVNQLHFLSFSPCSLSYEVSLSLTAASEVYEVRLAKDMGTRGICENLR